MCQVGHCHEDCIFRCLNACSCLSTRRVETGSEPTASNFGSVVSVLSPPICVCGSAVVMLTAQEDPAGVLSFTGGTPSSLPCGH